MSNEAWFAVPAATFGAATQAVSGLGFSIVCVPVFTLAYGGRDGVRLVNFLAVAVNALVLVREGRHADPGAVIRLLIPATVTAIIAAIVISRSDADVLSVVAGAVVLLAVVALARGRRVPMLAGRGGAVVAGAVSGAMNVVAGVGGPTVASYASNAGWPPARLRPTLASYFLGLNAVSVAARGVPHVSHRLLAAFAAVIIGGYVAGVLVRRRVDAEHLRAVTLVLAAAGAVAAIIKGIL